MWTNLNLCAQLVRMQNRAATVEDRMAVAQKIKQLLYDPAILLLGIHPKELKRETLNR